jgi:MFS transporter, DHA1 family, multidrug resistance protein
MSIEVEGTVSAAGHGRQAGAAARRIVICALAATGILATNIFLPSLPVIAADLHVSSAAVTSAFTIFLAIFAIGQLIAGPLSDRFGRRMPILIGLGIFIAGTIWCAFARDLSSLLIGRSMQACGACAASVLSRAIARDLFDGQALAKVMASITMATAAAPGFSPLLGSALDLFFGWRSEFAFVAAFALCTALAYATFVGETNDGARRSLNPLKIASSYLELVRDRRFVAPARTAGLVMAGLFAIFSSAPRVLLESFGFSPITLGQLFAGVVFLVFAAGMLAPRLSARVGTCRATSVGLGLTVLGGVGLLCAVLLARRAAAISVSGFRLSVRRRSGEPAVERGSAVAVWQQGRYRRSPVRILANGGRCMRCLSRGDCRQRSGRRARNRADSNVARGGYPSRAALI